MCFEDCQTACRTSCFHRQRAVRASETVSHNLQAWCTSLAGCEARKIDISACPALASQRHTGGEIPSLTRFGCNQRTPLLRLSLVLSRVLVWVPAASSSVTEQPPRQKTQPAYLCMICDLFTSTHAASNQRVPRAYPWPVASTPRICDSQIWIWILQFVKRIRTESGVHLDLSTFGYQCCCSRALWHWPDHHLLASYCAHLSQ